MLINKVRAVAGGCKVLVELGKNNSGKGTCAIILKCLLDKIGQPCHIISMSTIIGGHIKKFRLDSSHKLGESLAAEIQKQARGELMSDEPVIRALLEYLVELKPNQGSILILDGFPRTMNQWKVLVKIWPNAEFTYHEVSDQLVRQRAHIRFMKEGRGDDKPTEVNRRLAEYAIFTEPVVRASKKHANERGNFRKIEAVWPIREQIKAMLRFLGFYGNTLGSMLSCFDNPNHDVAKLVVKINEAEKLLTKTVGTLAINQDEDRRPVMRAWMIGVSSNHFSHLRGLEGSPTVF